MSERAEIDRRMRRLWAGAGSSHDRIVRILKAGLPLVIGVVAAVLVFSPFANRDEVSFLLSKDSVEVARERLRVERATYRGQDNRGHPFALMAASAVQKSSSDPVVRMTNLSGAIRLSDGPAAIFAANGAYDMDRETVGVTGAITVTAANGYRLEARDVVMDLRARRLMGTGGVDGALNIGRFSANRLEADLDARTVKLLGNARLTINQGVLR
jgi:lipopolysaccharide export system protein LptC